MNTCVPCTRVEPDSGQPEASGDSSDAHDVRVCVHASCAASTGPRRALPVFWPFKGPCKPCTDLVAFSTPVGWKTGDFIIPRFWYSQGGGGGSGNILDRYRGSTVYGKLS